MFFEGRLKVCLLYSQSEDSVDCVEGCLIKRIAEKLRGLEQLPHLHGHLRVSADAKRDKLEQDMIGSLHWIVQDHF